MNKYDYTYQTLTYNHTYYTLARFLYCFSRFPTGNNERARAQPPLRALRNARISHPPLFTTIVSVRIPFAFTTNIPWKLCEFRINRPTVA